MKISDVLWKAANACLRHDDAANGFYHSCDAVVRASDWDNDTSRPAIAFLRDLGCPAGFGAFDEFRSVRRRQGARYLWLMFAYLVAKDEGL